MYVDRKYRISRAMQHLPCASMAPILSPREIFPSNSWSHFKQHKYDEALNRDDDGSDVVHSLVAAKKVLRRMNMSKCGKILPQDENGDVSLFVQGFGLNPGR